MSVRGQKRWLDTAPWTIAPTPFSGPSFGH